MSQTQPLLCLQFLAKRDHLTEVPGAAKPELNFPSKDKSDVLHAFECTLALSRVNVLWQSSASSRLLPVLQHQPVQGLCAGALAA